MSITKTEFGGRLTIDYFSLEDLESMLERMRQEKLGAARTPVPADYQDESKDTVVSDEVDEEMATLAELARATGIEPVVPLAVPAPAVPEPVPVEPMAPIVTAVESPAPVTPTPPVPAEPVKPVIPVVSVPTPVSVSPIADTGAKPSLRDQLASLLGNRAPVAETMPTPVAPAPQPVVEAKPLRETEPPKTSPDDDLYSVTKFTI